MSNRKKPTATRIRLVATDLDGTLLRNDQTVSARTRQALFRAAAAGVTLTLVTGRPPRFVRQLAQDLGLDGAAICCNGALVYDVAQDALLEHNPLSAADASAIAHDLRAAAPGVTFAVERGLLFSCEPGYCALRGRLWDGRVEELQALCAQPVTKLLMLHPTQLAEELYPMARDIVGQRGAVTYSSRHYIEVSAVGVTKAATLARLCQRLEIAPAEVAAFGDMPNDADMLRWAGHGVAVANAHAEALAAASHVTASNMDDGVALALEKLLDRHR